MTFQVVASPFYLNIPSQTLGANGFDTGNLGFGQTVNITLVASSANSGTITITIWDQYGQQRPYSLLSGAPVLIKKAVVTRMQLSGSGNAVGGALSWPDEVSPESIVVNAPITISGTVKTDVGQGTQAAGNTTLVASGTEYDARQIRNLTSSDQPQRSWTLGLSDGPYAMGSQGLPMNQRASDNSVIHARAGNQTIVETEGFIVNVASGTGATVYVSGTTTVPKGTKVTYTLGGGGVITTATAVVGVWLQGAISSSIYAAAPGGTAISSSFDMPVAEKLNLVIQNSDSVNHTLAGTWQGTSP
jgi:hypothetical protein